MAIFSEVSQNEYRSGQAPPVKDDWWILHYSWKTVRDTM